MIQGQPSNSSHSLQKKIGFFLLPCLLLLVSCRTFQNDITLSPTLTPRPIFTPPVLPVTPPAIAPPYTDVLYYEADIVVGFSWSWFNLPEANSVFYIERDGTVILANDNTRGVSVKEEAISLETVALIQEKVVLLQNVTFPSHLDGDLAITVYVPGASPFTAVCGNRNCPLLVREILWYGTIPSPI